MRSSFPLILIQFEIVWKVCQLFNLIFITNNEKMSIPFPKIQQHVMLLNGNDNYGQQVYATKSLGLSLGIMNQLKLKINVDV